MRGPNFTKLGEEIGRSFLQKIFFRVRKSCCIFQTRAAQICEWCWKWRQISHFL